MRINILRRLAASAAVAALPIAAAAQQDPTKPLGDTTLEIVTGRLIAGALSLIGSLSLVVFIWSGFRWMTAGGNADQIKEAKRSFAYASIGIVVCFASFAILQFVLNGVIGPVLQ